MFGFLIGVVGCVVCGWWCSWVCGVFEYVVGFIVRSLVVVVGMVECMVDGWDWWLGV